MYLGSRQCTRPNCDRRTATNSLVMLDRVLLALGLICLDIGCMPVASATRERLQLLRRYDEEQVIATTT